MTGTILFSATSNVCLCLCYENDVRPSVCLSVCLSVTLVVCDHVHCSSTKSENGHVTGRCPSYTCVLKPTWIAVPYDQVYQYRVWQNVKVCTSAASSRSHVALSQHLLSFSLFFSSKKNCANERSLCPILVVGMPSAGRPVRHPAIPV